MKRVFEDYVKGEFHSYKEFCGKLPAGSAGQF